MEIAVYIGMGVITLLQAANLAQSKRLENKVGQMVCNETCGERRGTCRTAVDSKASLQDREIRIVERRLGAHMHNGGGSVKFPPVDTR